MQWWSNKTITTFENLTHCFIDQYENITIEGVDDHVSTECFGKLVKIRYLLKVYSDSEILEQLKFLLELDAEE